MRLSGEEGGPSPAPGVPAQREQWLGIYRGCGWPALALLPALDPRLLGSDSSSRRRQASWDPFCLRPVIYRRDLRRLAGEGTRDDNEFWRVSG